MKISRPWTVITASAFAVMLGGAGCGGGGGSGGGSGGTSAGSGGHGSGGTTGGSGGTTGSGGSSGSGGKVGSGGSGTGSGGATATGGKAGSGGAVGSGGAGTASGGSGMPGSGGAGTASGGSGMPGSGGAGTASGGSGPGGGMAMGGATGSGGMGTTGWQCPAASMFTGMAPFSGSTMAATRIAGAPPADSFNNMGNNFTNVEGPVWIGDALYYSEMTGANLPPARILKLAADDTSSVFIDNSGSNGLATDGTNIFSANHGAQGIVKFSLPDKTPTTLVAMYNGKQFNSPNDLTIAQDGTIYFTDPAYQNTAMPQGADGVGTRVYQLPSGASTAVAVTDYLASPNGISLSLDEHTLIVGGKSGVKQYAISDGTVAMTGKSFGPMEVTMSGVNTDGMTLDCAGNLYVAVASTTNVIVVKPDGTKLGTITISGAQAVTNAAFGGADHQTLFLTGQGSGKNQGVFKIHLNIPGKPY